MDRDTSASNYRQDLPTRRREMLRHIGIDEAGYGPRLGPLVVGYSVFEGPGNPEARFAAVDEHHRPRDSKLLLQGKHGFRRLETLALAAHFYVTGRRPSTIRDLFPDEVGARDAHPWYRDRNLSLPHVAPWGEVERVSEAIRNAASGEASNLISAGVRIIPEGELNRRIEQGQNKAEVHLGLIGQVLLGFLSEAGCHRVDVDRLGGRKHYGSWLQHLQPEAPVWVVEETQRRSAYRVLSAKSNREFQFLVGGESRSTPIALASCMAKYMRELLMILFNTWWLQRAPIRATAGYPEDAARFLRELDLHCPEDLQKFLGTLVRLK
mgnify:CR=1 FL=1